MHDDMNAYHLAFSLPDYITAMRSQPRRQYAEPWDDWTKPNEPANRLPVVYALWASQEQDIPIYVGQTVNLWKRLSEHFHADHWRVQPKFVTFIELPEFENPSTVSLVEKFLIATMQPTENDPRR